MKLLALDDRSRLESILRFSGDFLSEYCFSNLYLFRKKHHYSVEEAGGCLFIRGVSYDGLSYVMPCCLKQLECPEYREELVAALDHVDMIFPVPSRALAFFSAEEFRFESMQEDLDYIYEREKMRLYPGRRLQSKRNLLYQFLKNEPNHRIAEIDDPEARKGAFTVLERWQAESGFEVTEDTDYEPCREALELYDRLGLCGFTVFGENGPVGFLIGEPIQDDVFAYHFAKGDKSVKGIYQFLFSAAASRLAEGYSYINMEQDLGNLPLRASKSSYLPDMMAQKYRIFKR